MEIVLATENLHKVREFREMLKGLDFEILSLTQFPDYKAPEETGKNFVENAELKALHAAKALGKIAIADDSGLVVPALGGAPGVYSRRYAGEKATDSENRKKLLKAMLGFDETARSAYFECCLCLANLDGIKKSISAKVEGQILTEERGRNGFGYDPLFQKYDMNKSFAELSESTKNRISHRYKAIEKLLPFLSHLK